jgi:hypothetical protein
LGLFADDPIANATAFRQRSFSGVLAGMAKLNPTTAAVLAICSALSGCERFKFVLLNDSPSRPTVQIVYSPQSQCRPSNGIEVEPANYLPTLCDTTTIREIRVRVGSKTCTISKAEIDEFYLHHPETAEFRLSGCLARLRSG